LKVEDETRTTVSQWNERGGGTMSTPCNEEGEMRCKAELKSKGEKEAKVREATDEERKG
jgi:hypothetical protein